MSQSLQTRNLDAYNATIFLGRDLGAYNATIVLDRGVFVYNADMHDMGS